jgi:hypothetical protein
LAQSGLEIKLQGLVMNWISTVNCSIDWAATGAMISAASSIVIAYIVIKARKDWQKQIEVQKKTQRVEALFKSYINCVEKAQPYVRHAIVLYQKGQNPFDVQGQEFKEWWDVQSEYNKCWRVACLSFLKLEQEYKELHPKRHYDMVYAILKECIDPKNEDPFASFFLPWDGMNKEADVLFRKLESEARPSM